jgi:hypothetical protein
MQPTGFAVTAMRTTPRVCPDDGLKKLSAHRFIGKRFPKTVDVHTASFLEKLEGTVSTFNVRSSHSVYSSD